MAKANTHVGL